MCRRVDVNTYLLLAGFAQPTSHCSSDQPLHCQLAATTPAGLAQRDGHACCSSQACPSRRAAAAPQAPHWPGQGSCRSICCGSRWGLEDLGAPLRSCHSASAGCAGCQVWWVAVVSCCLLIPQNKNIFQGVEDNPYNSPVSSMLLLHSIKPAQHVAKYAIGLACCSLFWRRSYMSSVGGGKRQAVC